MVYGVHVGDHELARLLAGDHVPGRVVVNGRLVHLGTHRHGVGNLSVHVDAVHVDEHDAAAQRGRGKVTVVVDRERLESTLDLVAIREATQPLQLFQELRRGPVDVDPHEAAADIVGEGLRNGEVRAVRLEGNVKPAVVGDQPADFADARDARDRAHDGPRHHVDDIDLAALPTGTESKRTL